MDMKAVVRPETLADLRMGAKASIHSIKGDAALRQRLAELGFVRGAEVSLDRTAPLGNPRIYVICSSKITLRNEDARNILLQP